MVNSIHNLDIIERFHDSQRVTWRPRGVLCEILYKMKFSNDFLVTDTFLCLSRCEIRNWITLLDQNLGYGEKSVTYCQHWTTLPIIVVLDTKNKIIEVCNQKAKRFDKSPISTTHTHTKLSASCTKPLFGKW